MHSTCRKRSKTACEPWPRITSEQLHAVREPLLWRLDFGRRSDTARVLPRLCRAVLGPVVDHWNPPSWLLPHQVDAVRRVAGSLEAFGGAVLADAVGLGKTYMALAVRTRYRRTAVIVPAPLLPQWRRVSSSLGLHISLASHESLSRGNAVPPADLVIIDEAHRLRNPKTRRYDRLARDAASAHMLLVTATPVVNRAADLAHLLRLFLPDHGLALLGVRSLEQLIERRAHAHVTRATAPLIVARSARSVAAVLSKLPQLSDGGTSRPAPLPNAQLGGVLPLLDALEFPNTGSTAAAELLRLHLLFRLASSTAACRETLRRHLAYHDRALAAAARGERLSRGDARFLFGPGDELQLELGALGTDGSEFALDADALEQERNRIVHLLRVIPNGRHANPKADRVARLLERRRGQKTIVFTTAVATAMDLARRLEWREIAVVGAGRARIASGPVSVETALSLFAPHARAAPAPPKSARVSILIATDLASEGLDLQDANGVVHFDLPWTPLRLVQRVGRIARLGSEHATATVWWFVPPPVLECRLRLARRLHEKAESQLALGVTTTSVVGKARVWSEAFEWRERLGMGAAGAGEPDAPHFAVVRGPLATAVAIRWLHGGHDIPELVVLQGTPPQPVRDFQAMDEVLERLSSASTSPAPPPQLLVDYIVRLVRDRLAATQSGPRTPELRCLAQRVLQHARSAGHSRQQRRLALLDAILDCISYGLRVGQERELGDLLRGRLANRRLRAWLSRQGVPAERQHDFQLDAALFGDGTAD